MLFVRCKLVLCPVPKRCGAFISSFVVYGVLGNVVIRYIYLYAAMSPRYGRGELLAPTHRYNDIACVGETPIDAEYHADEDTQKLKAKVQISLVSNLKDNEGR